MDSAAVPSVDPPRNGRSVTSLFAAAPKWSERRKVIRITGDRESGFKSEVVKDFDVLYREERSALERALQELSDADDSPQAQQYLMQAWTAMAMYLANTDDEDKAAAMQVLALIGSMVNDGEDDSDNPSKPSAFNASRRSDGAAAVKCPTCGRSFATPDGLKNHMKSVHTKSGDGKTPTPPGKGK